MAVKDYLVKRPFFRVQNSGLFTKGEAGNVAVSNMAYTEKEVVGMPMTQTDLLTISLERLSILSSISCSNRLFDLKIMLFEIKEPK